MKYVSLSGGFLFSIAFIILLAILIVRGCSFDWNCGQYIQRAATANTVEMAKPELDKAIEFAKVNGLTRGNTDVLFTTPANDIEFWYSNLVNARAELDNVAESSPLEKTNTLMKLRESLVQQSNKGEPIKAPHNISLYPYQVLFWICFIITLALASLGFFGWLIID